MSSFVTRFAPSPTGLLHIGHAYSARLAHNAAKAASGRFLLRIEDIDQTRCKPAFETAIYEDLSWLGLDWETPVRRQSDHFDDYERTLETLIEMGVVYRCFKTRKEVADEISRAPHLSASGPEGPQYVGAPLPQEEEAIRISNGDSFAWRLSTLQAKTVALEKRGSLSFTEEGSGPNGENGVIAATPEIFGDPIIARKDAGTSYHLASVHDDALQGITHVIRGVDLFHAAHVHCLLGALLDYPPVTYHSHRLILNKDGKRLAKRDKDETIHALRESGASVADVNEKLGALDP